MKGQAEDHFVTSGDASLEEKIVQFSNLIKCSGIVQFQN